MMSIEKNKITVRDMIEALSQVKDKDIPVLYIVKRENSQGKFLDEIKYSENKYEIINVGKESIPHIVVFNKKV
ncbi:hypothetical protein [Brachyspira hyodysenteriae]|uniref:hypothetical protein n=1 Tax=Brachyspira hyodysenteriae TaxID=159 RepID=UPI00063DA374|nr:hypothetical protein [Brachyspira hyodysenteriae]KLI53655.1 hypothetical protein SZ42_00785 [Brachyspira hyodysenteriae]HJH54786.1 hypothetical protein [Brachyspira hyodysenteriae]